MINRIEYKPNKIEPSFGFKFSKASSKASESLFAQPQNTLITFSSRDHFNHLLVKPNISFNGKAAAKPGVDLTTLAINLNEELEKLQANPSSYSSPALPKLLKQLDDKLGCKNFKVVDLDDTSKMININSGLTLEALRKDPKAVEKLMKTINAMRAATYYEPGIVDFDSYKLPVHNSQIAEVLKPQYDGAEFNAVYSLCNDNGTFGLNLDRSTGLPRTSDIASDENWEMADRIWVTDTCRNIGLMKKDPQNRQYIPKALTTVAKFYCNQQEAFDKIIATPQDYNPYIDNPDKDAAFSYKGEIKPLNGVGHIFLPRTLQEDPTWFNRRRLESIGLFLKNSCDAITNKMGDQGDWGFEKVDDSVINAIATTAKYLQAIDYAYAPSAGNWEEIPLSGGLTWDTESIKEGFKSLKKLLFDKKYDGNPQIQEIRTRLQDSKYADLLKDPKKLDKLIKDGEDRVNKYHNQEAPGIRDNDSSLAFIAQSQIPDDNALGVVKRNFETLETVEKNLVRDNGAIRYSPFKFNLKSGEKKESPDSYLTYGYELAVTPDGKISLDMQKYKEAFGAKDCSDPEIFAARSKLSPGDQYTAQWFMVSDVSKGYGVQLAKLLELYKKESQTEQKQELLELIKKSYAKETEYINRAYARVTGMTSDHTPPVKANGENGPVFKVPEAYMAVPTLDGKIKFLPGTNTPLTWAQTSLYEASTQYMDNLKELEQSGLLDKVRN